MHLIAVIYICLLQTQKSIWQKGIVMFEKFAVCLWMRPNAQVKDLTRGHQGLSRPTWAPPGEPGLA